MSRILGDFDNDRGKPCACPDYEAPRLFVIWLALCYNIFAIYLSQEQRL